MIRDKLGDSVIAFQALASYRAAHPDDELTVMVHKHYLPLFERESGYRFVPYASSVQALAWAVWQRLTFRRFDVLLVLRGSGSKVVTISRILSAKIRIHALNRYPDAFPDTPPDPGWALTSKEPHIEAAMRSMRSLDPLLPYPERLSLPKLARYRDVAEAVVICPVSDEIRRSLSRDDVSRMIPEIRKRHPDRKIWVLVRHLGEQGFVAGSIDDAQVKPFETIDGLLRLFGKAVAYYGVDTGLYHVAAAMDIPSIVVFGPSQPYKVILSAQRAEAIRLDALEDKHCDNKACSDPVCIHRVVSEWIGIEPEAAQYPSDCPLESGTTRLSSRP